jgi:hypothetical protein
MNKECITWEIAKTKSEVLSDKCPLQEVCKGGGCLMSQEKPKEEYELELRLAGSLK